MDWEKCSEQDEKRYIARCQPKLFQFTKPRQKTASESTASDGDAQDLVADGSQSIPFVRFWFGETPLVQSHVV